MTETKRAVFEALLESYGDAVDAEYVVTAETEAERERERAEWLSRFDAAEGEKAND